MGGAPPLPLGFAPQEAKKRPFFGPQKGPKTGLWTPRIRRTARRGPDRGLPGRADTAVPLRRTGDPPPCGSSTPMTGGPGIAVVSGSRPPRRDPGGALSCPAAVLPGGIPSLPEQRDP